MNTAGPQLTINTHLRPFDLNKTEDSQEVSRFVRLSRVSPAGGGAIARSEDGNRCVVTGKETLRILRMSSSSYSQRGEHKSATGEGGYRIDASRNFWDGSGLKIDSTSTDVAWGYGLFNNKILTSARNGEVIMWDLGKAGPSKYERRSKDHTRSINKLSVSQVVHHYCITGSADGDLRVWDLRDMTKSILRVFHPTSVRSLVFSPSAWQPLQALVGLDNGSIVRWDLKMGQRGQLDRLHVAHTASVTSLDWCPVGGISMLNATSATSAREDSSSSGLGWIVSGGLDRTVKVWDLTAPGLNTHIPHKPTYVLHPSFPVRRVAWRPEYQCELAIVSNAEFGAVESQQTSNVGINATLPRSGSMIGLDSLLRGPSALGLAKEKLSSTETMPSNFGDVIEIWDVRRNWIAKWSVSGSGAECGVCDVAFSGSHAIWAHHTSGAFTQFDLHETSKPLDAIPRAALCWEATGSMAFVVDRKDNWEVPYDDFKSDIGTDIITEVRKPGSKALGDPVAGITSQVIANYSHDFLCDDIDSFVTLARGYIFEGTSRVEICSYNSGVALSAGNELAAQVWLLLGASIAKYLPSDSQESRSPSRHDSGQIKSSSEDASQLTEYTFPSSLVGRHASASHKKSPGRISIGKSLARMSRSASASTSRRMTPASSASPSPRHTHISLPPISPRRASFLRHDSADPASVNRRPSLTVSLGGPVAHHNTSPGDKSTPSLRHVGEGVLDDSDSSGGSEGDGEGEATAGPYSSDESASKPRVSPGFGPLDQEGSWLPTSSPLLQIARGQPWRDGSRSSKEDDDDDDEDEDTSSPSPRSTSDPETDSQAFTAHRKPGGSKSRSHSRSGKHVRKTSNGKIAKSRSRSSTVASLAAPPLPQRPKLLAHQDSHSSIRTVTAAETSMLDQNTEAGRSGQNGGGEQDFRLGHTRQRSVPMSEFMLNAPTKVLNLNDHAVEFASEGFATERRIEIIRAEDMRYREVTLKALKKVVEEYSEEGNVQMCSMLSLVAAEELGISKTRAVRFLDSYIDILTRLRLHTCAAYLRKSCGMGDVRNQTLIGTTIYSACGKCRKPVMVPAKTSEPNKGRYAYCSTCLAPCVRCSICHLPVQALLFQCSVCHHGGHQACYRNYYLNYPMVDLPTTSPPPVDDDRDLSTRLTQSASGIFDDDWASTVSMPSSGIDVAPSDHDSPEVNRMTKLKGHPCAAGCGHFCWAASGEMDDFC